MSSLRKIESSRANGALSHGPVTDAGKQISSQNALRHGLLAQFVRLDFESEPGIKETLDEHVERFQPADPVEFGIVEEMVAAYWRMRRSWCIETDLLNRSLRAPNSGGDFAALGDAFKNEADSRALALLHRYETRLHNMYQRGLRNILLLRKTRVPKEPNPIFGHSGSAPQPGPLPPQQCDPGSPGVPLVECRPAPEPAATPAAARSLPAARRCASPSRGPSGRRSGGRRARAGHGFLKKQPLAG